MILLDFTAYWDGSHKVERARGVVISLDIHTLHVEHVVLLAIYTVLTVSNSLLYKGMKGIHWFSLYNFAALLGALSVALRGQIPDFVSIVLGTLFVIAGYCLLYMSVSALFGRRARGLYLQVALIAVGAVAMLELGWLHPNTKWRLFAYSLILFCQQMHIAIYVALKRHGTVRVPGSVLGLVLACLSMANFVRAAGIVLQGAPANYLNAGPFLAWILIVNSCLQCGAMVAYVWMTAALLRSDLQRQASTDPLTKLLNRRAIELAADAMLADCRRQGMPACAIVLDLDEFKEINDEFGHSCGDAALIAVAECLRHGLGRLDLLARLGGDEFAVLLPDASLVQAAEMAEALREAIAGTEVVHGAHRTRIAATLGVALAGEAGWRWDPLMTRCDQALYTAKRLGGNQVGVMEQPEMVREDGIGGVSLQSALSTAGESNTIV